MSTNAISKHICIVVLMCLLGQFSCSASADLIFVNTGNGLDGYTAPLDDGSGGGTAGDDIPDSGLTTLTHSENFLVSGVSFDLSFDLSSTNGFLSAVNGDTLGVWNNMAGETNTGGNAGSLNGPLSEALTVNNVVLSNIMGGSAVFNTINRVGIVFATAGGDAGTFTVGASTFIWDDLDDGDPFDVIVDLDGGSGNEAYDLRSANGSDLSAFSLTATGGAFRLDAVEFDVTTSAAAVPEPSSLALLAVGSLGLVVRRQRKRRVESRGANNTV